MPASLADLKGEKGKCQAMGFHWLFGTSPVPHSHGVVSDHKGTSFGKTVFWDLLVNLNVYQVLLFLENKKNWDFHWDSGISLGVIPNGNQPWRNSPTASLQLRHLPSGTILVAGVRHPTQTIPMAAYHVLGDAGWSSRHSCSWRMHSGQAGPGWRLSVPLSLS